MQVTKETLMGELLRYDIDTAQILMGAGMHCIGSVSYTHLTLPTNEYLTKKNA